MITQWIRTEIQEGRLKGGQRIESENSLCERFNVSRTSVRKAIANLVAEGVLESRHGIGTFCVDSARVENGMVALVCFYSESYIWPQLIAGFDSVIHTAGQQIILGQSELSFDRERDVLKRLERSGTRAIAIEPLIRQKKGSYESNRNTFNELRNLGVSFVLIDDDFQDDTFSSITMNNFRGGEIAAKYLYEKGHRKIAIIRVTDLQFHCRREEGARSFLKGKKCDPKAAWLVEVPTPYGDGFDGLVSDVFAPGKEYPTAVICTNDQMAVNLFNFLNARNIRVPEDVSIVGFDNSDFAKQPAMDITTINNPSRYVGEKAAQMLLEAANRNNAQSTTKIVVDPVLVERSSVKDRR
jgi:GntR family transcriptional regulator of arabinose operon